MSFGKGKCIHEYGEEHELYPAVDDLGVRTFGKGVGTEDGDVKFDADATEESDSVVEGSGFGDGFGGRIWCCRH